MKVAEHCESCDGCTNVATVCAEGQAALCATAVLPSSTQKASMPPTRAQCKAEATQNVVFVISVELLVMTPLEDGAIQQLILS